MNRNNAALEYEWFRTPVGESQGSLDSRSRAEEGNAAVPLINREGSYENVVVYCLMR